MAQSSAWGFLPPPRLSTCLRRTPLSGAIIAERWGEAILTGPVSLHSHGADAARYYGSGGARAEAAQGLPSVYKIALPALRAGRAFSRSDEAARVHACMALIASVEDTNLLHRGGLAGLAFAQAQASDLPGGRRCGTNGLASPGHCYSRSFHRPQP